MFTPGPWTCERQDQDEGEIYFAIHGKNYEFITNVYESKPNARLIAAAPDLYGALNFILAFYEPGQRYLDTEAWKVAEASARAAMRKARGETP
jgi:hypothetical protein